MKSQIKPIKMQIFLSFNQWQYADIGKRIEKLIISLAENKLLRAIPEKPKQGCLHLVWRIVSMQICNIV
jgi:hypothetical protein